MISQVAPPSPALSRREQGRQRRAVVWFAAAAVWFATPLFASDHADPIDPFNRERLEGGITDLFVFPILADGQPAFPFARTDAIALATPDLKPRPKLTVEQRAQIKHLVVILCVRRALTETGSLRLEPYTYQIHMDHHSTVSFEDTAEDPPPEPASTSDTNTDTDADSSSDSGSGSDSNSSTDAVSRSRPSVSTSSPEPKRPTGAEARARYGGRIAHPSGISDDVLIEFKLKNDATIQEIQAIRGLKNAKEIRHDGKFHPDQISAWAGVRDDPFIFPPFFNTNVVAMVLTIPMTAFPEDRTDWLIWGTSHKGNRQVDHVGRSLLTQNPRFELLNTLPPNAHVAAIFNEHEDPGLLRDIALRLNFQAPFAYRKWDFVPDVMIYTTQYGVGFPNGRLLTDDVAALLAQHGDTLLLELSHHSGGWPRKTRNDKEFMKSFPYLAEPWPDRKMPPPPALSRASWFKLAGIASALFLLLALENWLVARWYYRKKLRQRYR